MPHAHALAQLPTAFQLGVLEAHQLLDRYRTYLLRDRHREQRTWTSYKLTLTSFWAHAAKPPHRVDVDDLHRYLYGRRLADSTRACYASHIKSAYRWWAAARLLPADPFTDYQVPPVHPGPARSLAEHDLIRLITSSYNQPRIYLMVWLAYGAGLRVAEIASLRVEDCQVFDRRPALRVHGKGRRERLVWLHPTVAEIIRGALVGRPQTGPLVESEVDPGRPISPARVSKLLSRALHEARVDASAHHLRHTFATFLLAEGHGRNIHAIQRLLGHASPATTERYVRGYDEDAHESAGLLPTFDPPDTAPDPGG